MSGNYRGVSAGSEVSGSQGRVGVACVAAEGGGLLMIPVITRHSRRQLLSAVRSLAAIRHAVAPLVGAPRVFGAVKRAALAVLAGEPVATSGFEHAPLSWSGP